MPELVSLAGGRNLFGSTGSHSPTTSWDDVRGADPDVVLVVPCGFDVATTRAHLGELTSRPGFAALRATREGRVYLADGNAYFNRPGPRLRESLEVLAEILHPEVFAFGHAGRGYERLEVGR
jgi:iron complex transport system substrate-binding protein